MPHATVELGARVGILAPAPTMTSAPAHPMPETLWQIAAFGSATAWALDDRNRLPMP